MSSFKVSSSVISSTKSASRLFCSVGGAFWAAIMQAHVKIIQTSLVENVKNCFFISLVKTYNATTLIVQAEKLFFKLKCGKQTLPISQMALSNRLNASARRAFCFSSWQVFCSWSFPPWLLILPCEESWRLQSRNLNPFLTYWFGFSSGTSSSSSKILTSEPYFW